MSTPYSNLNQSDIERLRHTPQGRAILAQMQRQRRQEEEQQRRAAMAAAEQQQASAAQEQAPEAPQRNPNVFFNTETGQHEFIVNYSYDDLTAYRDDREPEISVSQVNPAYVKQHPDAPISQEVQALQAAEKAAMNQLIFGSYKEAKAAAEAQGGTLDYHEVRYYHDTGDALIRTRTSVPVPPNPSERMYVDPNHNVMFGSKRVGDIITEELAKGDKGLYGPRMVYETDPFKAAAEAEAEARRSQQAEVDRMIREQAALGYSVAVTRPDGKGGKTIEFMPFTDSEVYAYVSDPVHPFNVQKVEITSPSSQMQETAGPVIENTPAAGFVGYFAGFGKEVYATFEEIIDPISARKKQLRPDESREIGPTTESEIVGAITEGKQALSVGGVPYGGYVLFTPQTFQNLAEAGGRFAESPGYFVGSAAATLALWITPYGAAKAVTAAKGSSTLRTLTTGRPYETTPRLHYPQTDYDPFNTGWFRSDNVPQRAFASSEPFSPSTVQKVTVATQAGTQSPTRTTSRRIDVPEGINPDPTPRATTDVIRRRTMTTLQDIDKRLGLDVRDRGSYTEVKTSSGTLLLQKRKPQQLRQETQTIQETTQTTATAQQQPIELLRVETEPPRPRPRPRPKEEPPKLDVQVRQTQNQITRASGSQRNQILVDLRQMGKQATDARTRQKQLLERQITLQTTQKIAQKPKLRAEQVRMTAQTQQSAAIQAYQQQFALKSQQLARTKPMSLTTQKYDFVRTTPGKGITLIKDPPKPPKVTIEKPPKPPVVTLPPFFGKGKKQLKVKDQLGITNLEKLAVVNPFAPGFSILGKGDQAKGAKYLLSDSKKRGKKNKGLFDV